MNLQQIIQALGERFQSNASIQTMYGVPYNVEGKTIIPVGRVSFGFGVGRGKSAGPMTEQTQAEMGVGMGGGVVAHPVGVMEVTPESTRFIPCQNHSALLRGAILGIGLGFLLWGRRS